MSARAARRNTRGPGSRPAASVAGVIAGYPKSARALLLEVRTLVLECAEALDVGPLTETLKWGEPAYLTEATRSGTTVRIAWSAKAPEMLSVLFHCQTTLVDTFRTRFPELRYDGNRAIVLDLDQPLPVEALRWCLSAALTYHQRR